MRLPAIAATVTVLSVPAAASADELRVVKTSAPPVSSLTADDFPVPPGVPIKRSSSAVWKHWPAAALRGRRR